MDPDAAKALHDDQRWFVKARDRAVERLRDNDLVVELEDRYRTRAAFLDSVTPQPVPGIVGTWGNIAGRLSLHVSERGYLIDGSGARPAFQGLVV